MLDESLVLSVYSKTVSLQARKRGERTLPAGGRLRRHGLGEGLRLRLAAQAPQRAGQTDADARRLAAAVAGRRRSQTHPAAAATRGKRLAICRQTHGHVERQQQNDIL